MLGQIEAVERDLRNPHLGKAEKALLEAKRPYLYAQRNALEPPEDSTERTVGKQLRARRLDPDAEPTGGRHLAWPDRKQINHEHRDSRITLEQRVDGLRIGATT